MVVFLLGVAHRGRPRIPEEDRVKRTYSRCPPRTLRKAKATAEDLGISLARFETWALEHVDIEALRRAIERGEFDGDAKLSRVSRFPGMVDDSSNSDASSQLEMRTRKTG
jgi:hypothetical protein